MLDPAEEDRAAAFRRTQAARERNDRARGRQLAGSQAARQTLRRERWWALLMPTAPVVEPEDSDLIN